MVLTVRQELTDGGMAILDFDAGHAPELEPTRHLRLSTNLPIHNYRIRVFDEADRAIASDDLAEDSASGLEYQIRFPESLKTGHRYALVIDAQTGDSVLDAHGHALADQRMEFQVLGPREKLPPKKKPAKRKRKRHSDNFQRAPPLLAVERLEDAEVGWARRPRPEVLFSPGANSRQQLEGPANHRTTISPQISASSKGRSASQNGKCFISSGWRYRS